MPGAILHATALVAMTTPPEFAWADLAAEAVLYFALHPEQFFLAGLTVVVCCTVALFRATRGTGRTRVVVRVAPLRRTVLWGDPYSAPAAEPVEQGRV